MDDGIKDTTKTSLRLFVENGVYPGNFLYRVLSNQLMESIIAADSHNKKHISDIVNYIYKHIPCASYGSNKKVDEWMNKKHKVRNDTT